MFIFHFINNFNYELQVYKTKDQLNSKLGFIISILDMESRLIGGHTHEDDDARTRAYLAEMRSQMAARLREQRWKQTEEMLAKKKEDHYKKWRRVLGFGF